MAEVTLRQRITSGAPVKGAMIFEMYSPGMATILKVAGCEFAIYDMEHSAVGFETIKAQCAVARGAGLPVITRVPSGDPSNLSRALDCGSTGVMIPMVESAEQARAIVEATHYPPAGRRGAAFGFAHDGYAPGSSRDKVAAANANTVVVVQIESEHGIDAVEAIAAVDGVDVLFFGQNDLTNFLGIPGDFAHPKLKAATARMIAAAKANKKCLGAMVTSAAMAAEYRALGFTLIAAGTDHGLLMGAIKAIHA
jgi:2-dehydro-3-deoxyglucarate aldolase/4-hydroxy-2-oxoheptanedioate aldolase